MTDISSAFRRKAFIPFVTVGDPDLETTERLVLAMAEEGADLIELGIPFSDPIAEGPVIQAADVRALANNITTDDVFELARRVRSKGCTVPLAIMTYANPVFVYGYDRFAARCAEVGVQALIVPDIPYEEKGTLLPHCRRHGVKLVSMIAPTSEARISTIASEAEGFLYIVSSMGVTGMRRSFSSNLEDMVAAARRATDIPCAVGFGISDAGQAARIAGFADGAIVGSAIVNIVAEHGRDSEPYVREFVRGVRKALDGVPDGHRMDASPSVAVGESF